MCTSIKNGDLCLKQYILNSHCPNIRQICVYESQKTSVRIAGLQANSKHSYTNNAKSKMKNDLFTSYTCLNQIKSEVNTK
jgi:hypothetical protein